MTSNSVWSENKTKSITYCVLVLFNINGWLGSGIVTALLEGDKE
jgi:hypothetical protein